MYAALSSLEEGQNTLQQPDLAFTPKTASWWSDSRYGQKRWWEATSISGGCQSSVGWDTVSLLLRLPHANTNERFN